MEQERRKGRAYAPKENDLDSESESSSFPQELSFSVEKPLGNNDGESACSETSDLEYLIEEKANLKEESRCLDEEQEKLNSQIKMICEQIIGEKKKKNREKQQEINKLKASIASLEAQLDTLSPA